MKPNHRKSPGRKARLRILVIILAAVQMRKTSANPVGMTVVSGSATTKQSGAQLNVSVGQTAILDWNSFNIGKGETTTFLQPSANSIVFNNIGGANPSQIWGNLNANGTVILANANGFYFGPNSMIRVGGNFIATTAPMPADLGAGSGWQFTGTPPLAGIVNYGSIATGAGHSLFLIAEQIENHGSLAAPAGTVGLYAGQTVLVSDRPDGRGLSASVQLPSGAVANTGKIVAAAGTIALRAAAVNQNGILQANSVRNQNGVIELVGSDQLNLGAASEILAHGDDTTPGSAGGTVTLKSGGTFSDTVGGLVVTSGGALGGNGGNVEVSAPNIASLNSAMDAGAQAGSTGGRLLLDPANITLGTTGSGSAGNGTVAAGDGMGTLALNVNTAFANKNFSAIDLQATGNITLSTGTTWNLSSSTGVSSGQLLLQAGQDIVFNNNAQIVDANNWSVSLQAGVNFTSGAVQSGTGNIYLNGGAGKTLSGAIQTASGSINLSAGESILVGSGFVRTTAGGSITANALAGDINAGTANGGYQFSIFGYTVSPNLGGISTAAGGDVSLTAGDNIISTPTVPANQPTGGSGAYGAQAGNVTLTAGNQVLGSYNVANGTGTILAGVQVGNGQVTGILNPAASVGTAQRPVSLSLIDGSWNVWAASDIFINEVRNPNGTFNANQLSVPTGVYSGNLDNGTVPTRSAFLFDYAPDASANFWAGNSINLVGSNLPRVTGGDANMPPIYPPSLSLNAGAGGINVENAILLYPSSAGSLQVITRDGGNLTGAQQQSTLVGITMSDSGLPDWNTFAAGHAITPLHLDDPRPVTLDITGGIQNFGLIVPTFAEITVAGDTYNFGFSGRNLSAAQTTSISVGGDITYRGDLTSVSLADPLPAELFVPALNGSPDVASKISYNAATGMLTFIGVMTATELAFLQNPIVDVVDSFGRPVLDLNGNPETKSVTISAAQQTAIQQLFTASQTASLGDQGLAIAGPGHFTISARNIDLGISGGISVQAPDSALAAISPYGADLTVTTSGNLEMTSTKIANESLLGGVELNVGGTLDVGGQTTTFGDPSAPKGIFTTSGGSVTVNAGGDVNVDGSRIAAYDGGNINVESLHGDVNAGAGGSGYVSMNSLELDPATGQLISVAGTIPGSGILATTIPGGRAALGNITIQTPEGSINASSGGIIQLAFNGANTRNNFIQLTAHGDINATGSGIIGSNVRLQADGNITGVVVGSESVNINSQQNVNVTAFSEGGISIAAIGNVSGTAIAPTVSVGASTITAALIANSVSAAGDTAGSSVGVPQATPPAETARATDDASTTVGKTDDNNSGDDEKKKRNRGIGLSRKTGRVTVILPNAK